MSGITQCSLKASAAIRTIRRSSWKRRRQGRRRKPVGFYERLKLVHECSRCATCRVRIWRVLIDFFGNHIELCLQRLDLTEVQARRSVVDRGVQSCLDEVDQWE